MPNIFVEALTIADGRVHSALREIFVPPEKKIANVEVLPSAERYRPGDEATVRLKLTDLNGEPFVGNTVLSVYDASLEYIAASSIPEIRSFFWNVRRRHNPSADSTLTRSEGPLHYRNEKMMQIFAGSSPQAVMFGGGGMGGQFGGAPLARNAMRRGRALAEPAAALGVDSEAVPNFAPMEMAKGAMAAADDGAGGVAGPRVSGQLYR